MEQLRAEAGLAVQRFCCLIDLPVRTYYARRQRAREGRTARGPWPTPARDGIRNTVIETALRYPMWGHRKIAWLCALDRGVEVAEATCLRIQAASEMLTQVDLRGYTVIADKGFAGQEFEQLMSEFGAIFRRPDRKGEPPRFGGLGSIRQWIESVFDTLKGQLSLEQHGAITMPGLMTRISQRLLALAAGLWHNWNTGQPGRHLTAYDH